MKITSWNVNSIKARGDHVVRYLNDESPDILMIQELKGEDFPHEKFKQIGYHSEAVGQKAYNGVAMISKEPLNIIATALNGDETDEQARYIEAVHNNTHIINIYLPNGNPTPGDKYDYKLNWMERLYTRLKALIDQDTPFIIGGDFNVIPENKDCHSPKDWRGDALFRNETHKAWRKLLNLGLTDAFRVNNTQDRQYTFWDYQAGAWQKDNGIRIDHFLLSPLVADQLESCQINKTPRNWEKPSDHTPIEITLGLP